MRSKADMKAEERRKIAALEHILRVVNVFPAAEEMSDIPVPLKPIALMEPLIGHRWFPERKQTQKGKAEEQDYQEALEKAVNVFLAELQSKGYGLAAALLADSTSLLNLGRLAKKAADAIDAAWNYDEQISEKPTEIDKNVGLYKFEMVADAVERLRKGQGDWAQRCIDVYYRMRSIKRLLGNLATVGRNLATSRRRLDRAGITTLHDLFPSVVINEKGIISVENDEVVNLFVGLDCRKIRKCKSCQNFLWVYRSDRVNCSEKCSDQYNQRLSRERKRERSSQYAQADKRRKRS